MAMAACQCATCKKRYRLVSKVIPMCDCRPRRSEPVGLRTGEKYPSFYCHHCGEQVPTSTTPHLCLPLAQKEIAFAKDVEAGLRAEAERLNKETERLLTWQKNVRDLWMKFASEPHKRQQDEYLTALNDLIEENKR